MATPTEVAQWMVDHIKADGLEYHDVMIGLLNDRFGSEWVPSNENGNPSIDQRVQRAFRKLHGGAIEWSRGEWHWVGAQN